ncbi:hypothetical protein N2605_14865 [Bradyrhizobium yuanmingense]|uniref:hypothetical protein n=1 Tax=Bradyrhizobium TaxID=374 RepID=UPI001CD433EF|nr:MULTISPECIES: hypothetical protein [unclassified Bradyrhizobium]MCA1380973.1 hypothetical protein [Bradyrhizobium sp. BRP05]MCA1388940.1 hypothetical protein [Bradyrhizobium sp. IC3123]MCA1418906.1 hypothetical protein [Bradyrhizobium sp. BRP23]MCA1543152.1 hypothetical protein [Bradyrhizobium sp. NBAIM32]MCA1546761.1 hypothetical protein [Bradyrhizobium sp. BRP19]
MITQLPDDFRFSGPEMPLCSLAIRIADLAKRFGFTLIHYQDDGLGWAASMFVRLESGRPLFLTEHAHAVEHLGAKGPVVEVDAQDIAEIDVKPFVGEVLEAFQLSLQDADWITPVDRAYARDWIRWWADHVAKRDRAGNGESPT